MVYSTNLWDGKLLIRLPREMSYAVLVPILEREGYFFKAHRPWRNEDGTVDTTPWHIFKEETALLIGDKLIQIVKWDKLSSGVKL